MSPVYIHSQLTPIEQRQIPPLYKNKAALIVGHFSYPPYTFTFFGIVVSIFYPFFFPFSFQFKFCRLLHSPSESNIVAQIELMLRFFWAICSKCSNILIFKITFGLKTWSVLNFKLWMQIWNKIFTATKILQAMSKSLIFAWNE